MEQDKFKIGEWIEQQKLWIGGLLLLFILVGSGILLWRENYQKLDQEYRLVRMENRILELEGKVNNNQVTNNNNQTNSNIQPQNNQTSNTTENSNDGQGNVAGVSTSGSSGTLKQVQGDKKVVGLININTASASELDTLPGIGATYAQRIIEYRSANGPYTSIDDIKKVKGIGEKTFEKFKDKITVQ